METRGVCVGLATQLRGCSVRTAHNVPNTHRPRRVGRDENVELGRVASADERVVVASRAQLADCSLLRRGDCTGRSPRESERR